MTTTNRGPQNLATERHNLKYFGNTPPVGKWVGQISELVITDYLPQNGALGVYLVLRNGGGVLITIEMIELDNFEEVGRVCIEYAPLPSLAVQAFRTIKLDPVISYGIIEFSCDGISVETGLMFLTSSGERLQILSAAFPFHFALLGFDEEFDAEPAYNQQFYRVPNFQSV
jgi:hypothetical protein